MSNISLVLLMYDPYLWVGVIQTILLAVIAFKK
jgi:hypothetical protein